MSEENNLNEKFLSNDKYIYHLNISLDIHKRLSLRYCIFIVCFQIMIEVQVNNHKKINNRYKSHSISDPVAR